MMNLKLDVYQPSRAGLPALLPGVIVIHGGAFTSGTKSDPNEVKLGQRCHLGFRLRHHRHDKAAFPCERETQLLT